MVTPTGPWSREKTTAFLDRETIPLRLACHTPGGGIWLLSLWYLYRDGAFHCATSADADVVRFLRADADAGFEVSTNRPPYRGVRGRGSARVEPDPEKELLGELVDRYLGDDDSDLARWLLSPEREEVTIRIDPAKLVTWDFSDRMPAADEGET
jgi:nitroimidazol reductase NimA-like FMN-containing flavoprotein (pyridoxamine 5'-phosphate oxidase superfamily)